MLRQRLPIFVGDFQLSLLVSRKMGAREMVKREKSPREFPDLLWSGRGGRLGWFSSPPMCGAPGVLRTLQLRGKQGYPLPGPVLLLGKIGELGYPGLHQFWAAAGILGRGS